MKILLLGKNGQVGRSLQQTLSSLGGVIALGREDVDLTNISQLSEILAIHHPNIIVNAAAYTAVDKAESEFETSYLINEKAVSVMAEYARVHQILLIHYSTDYVFDGSLSRAYREVDLPNPMNEYGRSKLAGEQAILKSECNALIFRTSWVISAHGNNFIKTILRLAQTKDSLNVVDDQYGAPASAEFIAEITLLAILAYQKQSISRGIYHLTPSGVTSWYHLAVYVLERAIANGMRCKLEPKQIKAIPTTAYPLPAKRPQNSRLNTEKLSQTLNIDFPDWRVGVDAVIDELICY